MDKNLIHTNNGTDFALPQIKIFIMKKVKSKFSYLLEYIKKTIFIKDVI